MKARVEAACGHFEHLQWLQYFLLPFQWRHITACLLERAGCVDVARRHRLSADNVKPV